MAKSYSSDKIMDGKILELNKNHAVAENILCRRGNLEEALQLSSAQGQRYYPLTLWESGRNDLALDGFWNLFLGEDRENDVIPRFFEANIDSPVFEFSTSNDYRLPYHHLLNLPNTPSNVRFRQGGVRELVENESAFKFIEEVLVSQGMYGYSPFGGRRETNYRCDVTPEKMRALIEAFAEMKGFSPKSGPLKALQKWGRDMEEDTLFRELVRKKRKVTDARLIAIYSERYKEVRYGLLRPEVNPEDVFDFLAKEVDHHDIIRQTNRGKPIVEKRNVAKYQRPEDGGLVSLAVGHARQGMNILNEITTKMLAVPGLLMLLQAKHLYQGAYMHKELLRRGYPSTFPEIVDEQGVLEVEGLLPVRMILGESCQQVKKGRQKLAANSFYFSPNQQVVHIEGPNKRGKSEAWRSLHLMTNLINAGYSVPASRVLSGVTSASHFISCKGESGHGGSELERGLKGVLSGLREVHRGDQVILDELGDAANAPTSMEIAKRVLPQLTNRGCRVLVTSHHHTLTQYISKELKGVSLMPDPKGKGVRKYVLIPSRGEIDFKAQETLNELGFTSSRVNKSLPKGKAPCKRRATSRREKYYAEGRTFQEEEEDLPF
jgi:hypothetical protein